MKKKSKTIIDFTTREVVVIQKILEGFTSKEIANQLNISEKTVKRHRENIAKKSGTSGKQEFRMFLRSLDI